MYINKMKSHTIVVSDKKLDNAILSTRITLAELRKFFCSHADIVWDELGEYVITSSPKAMELLTDLKRAVSTSTPLPSTRLFKLVVFPSKRVIRLCNQGRCKKTYKNSLLVTEQVMAAFKLVAKKYTSKHYTELHFADDPTMYNKWEKYISSKIEEILKNETHSD